MTELIVKSANKAEHKAAKAILREALNRQKKMFQTALLRTKENLEFFEKRYNTDTASFFAKYQRGETDDRDDYIDWAGEFQIFQSIQNQIGYLEELVLCK
ncbi:MAG TPA: hypothetical protein ENH29_03875 [Bacteroidetes bacterium]|nr:hypothetical protein [Bacteroidota bacterium]